MVRDGYNHSSIMSTSIVRLVPGATHWVRSGTMQPHSAITTSQTIQIWSLQCSGQWPHLGTAAARRLPAGPRTAPRCSTAPPPCSPRCSAAASPRRAAAGSPTPGTSCSCSYSYYPSLTNLDPAHHHNNVCCHISPLCHQRLQQRRPALYALTSSMIFW